MDVLPSTPETESDEARMYLDEEKKEEDVSMLLTMEEREDVSVSSVGKISSTKRKLPIQIRLENWQQPIPTEQSLQSKLDNASIRRAKHVSQTIEKSSQHIHDVRDKSNSTYNKAMEQSSALQARITQKLGLVNERKNQLMSAKAATSHDHLEKIKNTVNSIHQHRKDQVSALDEKLHTKVKNAEKSKNSFMSLTIGGISKMNLEKADKASSRKMDRQAAQERLKKELYAKTQLATERKNELLSRTVHGRSNNSRERKQMVTTSIQQKKKDQLQNLDVAIQKKIQGAMERKREVLQNISTNLSIKFADQQHRASTTQRSFSTKMEALEQKNVEAAVRRDQVLASRVTKSEQYLEKIQRASSAFSVKEATKIAVINTKLHQSFTRASEIKEQSKMTLVENLSLKHQQQKERVQLKKEADEESHYDLEKKVEAKMANAALRKEYLLTNTLVDKLSAVNKEKRATAEKIKDSSTQKVQDLKTMLNNKFSEALERKDSALTSIQARLSEENKYKQERAMAITKEFDSMKKNIERKMTEATERATERKASALASKSAFSDVHSKKVQSINEKTSEELSKLESKIAERTKKAEMNKANLTSTIKTDLSGKLEEKEQRLSRKMQWDQESQAKLQFEIYDKLEAANQRREEIIKENISGKLSETLSKKLQKANEVKENEMNRIKDLRATVEGKISSAMERKSKVTNERIENVSEMVKRKIERGLNVKESKNSQVSSKKEMIQSSLEEAAQRKDQLLKSKIDNVAEKNKSIAKISKDILTQRREDASVAGDSSDLVSVKSQRVVYDDDSVVNGGESVAGSVGTVGSKRLYKSAIQIKLEQWKRPTLSKEDLEVRLADANSRHKTHLTRLSGKSKKHLDHVKDVANHEDAQRKAKSSEIGENLSKKMGKVSQNKVELTSKIVNDLSKAHQEKAEKVLAKKQQSEEATSDIKVNMKEKIKSTVERKNAALLMKSFHAHRPESRCSVRDAAIDDKASTLEKKIQEKLDRAFERKNKFLSEFTDRLSSSMKEKQNRANMSKQSQESDLTSKKDKIESKLVEAAERKDQVIASKKASVEEHLNKVKDVHAAVDARDAETASALAQKLSLRSEKAAQVKMDFQSTISTKNDEKAKKLEKMKQDEEDAASILKENIDKKIEAAVQRKKIALLTSSTNSGYSSDAESVKINEIKKTKELQEKINEKVAKAIERKNQALSNITSSLSKNLQMKQERAYNTKLAHETRLFKKKYDNENSLVGAIERKSNLLKSKSVKAEEHLKKVKTASTEVMSQQADAVSALSTKLSEKASKKLQLKEELIKAMKDQIAKKNMIKSNKHDQHKDSTEKSKKELKEEIDNKVEAAAQRKEEFLTRNVTAKIAESLTKVKSVMEQSKKDDIEKTNALKMSIGEKISNAVERKVTVLNELSENISSSLKDKHERALKAKTGDESKKLNLDKKLGVAAQRKEALLYAKTSRVTNRLERVKTASASAKSRKEAKVSNILKKSSERNLKVEQNKENWEDASVGSLMSKNEEKFEKIAQIKEASIEAKVELKEKVHKKIEAAIERRNQLIGDKASTAKDHMEKVKTVFSNVNQQREEKVSVLLNKLSERSLKIEHHADDMSIGSNSTVSKNEEKFQKIAQIKQSAEEAKVKLAEKVTKKVEDAVQRRNQYIEENVLNKVTKSLEKKKLQTQEFMDDNSIKVKYLEEELEKKQTEVAEKKRKTLFDLSLNLANAAKDKQKRISDSNLAKDADASSKKEELFQKMNSAVDRKDHILASKKATSALKNSCVLERVNEKRAEHEKLKLELKHRQQSRMISATANRHKIRHNVRNGLKMDDSITDEGSMNQLEPIAEEEYADDCTTGSPEKKSKFAFNEMSYDEISLNPSKNHISVVVPSTGFTDSDSVLSFNTDTKQAVSPLTPNSSEKKPEKEKARRWTAIKNLKTKLFVGPSDKSQTEDSLMSLETEGKSTTGSVRKRNRKAKDDGSLTTMSHDDLLSLSSDTVELTISTSADSNETEVRNNNTNSNLSAEEFMKSLALAEAAAKNGISEFNTESKIQVLEKIELTDSIQKKLKRQEREKKVKGIFQSSKRFLGRKMNDIGQNVTKIDTSIRKRAVPIVN